MDSYRIPTKSGASEYVDKRSRFLGLVRPVGSEDEARTIIAACKKQYHDARHNCWCYLLRDGTERYSDDGEPQGTAGIPMLEVFRRAGVTNVVCVVTRYFGGVLLGTGGLLRAYTAAAADALADAGISEVRRWLACEVSTPYALYEPVRAAVAALGGVAAYLFGPWDALLVALLAVIALDYLTGVAAAAARRASSSSLVQKQ